MAETKRTNASTSKNQAGFLNDALDRAKKVFESTTSKVEQTGKKAWRYTEEIAESVSQKAEVAIQRIKDISQAEEAPYTSTPVKKSKKPLMFKTPRADITAPAHVNNLADDICDYLIKNGETKLDKIVNVMKHRKNTQLMIFCAIGWLLHENRVVIGADNTTVATK